MKDWRVMLQQVVRALTVISCCMVLMVGATLPSFALEKSTSQPTDGTVQLDEIAKRTEDVAKKPLSPQGYRARSQQGLNEVQGSADSHKMNRPDESEQSHSVFGFVKQGLDKVTNPS